MRTIKIKGIPHGSAVTIAYADGPSAEFKPRNLDPNGVIFSGVVSGEIEVEVEDDEREVVVRQVRIGHEYETRTYEED